MLYVDPLTDTVSVKELPALSEILRLPVDCAAAGTAIANPTIEIAANKLDEPVIRFIPKSSLNPLKLALS
jgi:hypothetical protein